MSISALDKVVELPGVRDCWNEDQVSDVFTDYEASKSYSLGDIVQRVYSESLMGYVLASTQESLI